MSSKEVSEMLKELRNIQEKHKNSTALIIGFRISDMAKDAADTIESLKAFVDLIGSLTTCNDCHRKLCEHKPQWGKTVRYNCPLYLNGEKQ
jgi:hypothetical protein